MFKCNLDRYQFFCPESGYPFDLDLVAARDELSNQKSALISLLEPDEKRVLDAGCGLGRFASALASHGAEVTGVDIVADLVKEASSREPRVRFVTGDIASLQFNSAEFDAVACMYSSLGYVRGRLLPELLELRRVCAFGGTLVLDILNPAVRSRSLGMETMPDGWGAFIRWRWFGMAHQINFALTRRRTGVFKTSVACPSHAEMEVKLQAADWKITEVFGDYSLNNFDEHSPRMIFKCQAA